MHILLQIQSEPSLFKIFHYATSLMFLIIAIWLLTRSYFGIVRGASYKMIDKVLSFAFIVNMYLQLIIGLIMFSNISTFNRLNNNAELVQDMASKRFWPVEHIVLMIFALFIANLGLIFSIKSKEDKMKFKKILTYYSLSILLIAISLFGIYFM